MNSTVKMGPGPTVPNQRPFHSYSSFFLAHIVIDFVISTPAILSNAILLITIFRDSRRQKQLCKSSFTLLVINLSLCDFISGAVPGCGSLYYDYMIFHTRTDEKLVGIRVMIITTGIITNVVGSCTVMAMSFDRLFAMESPLRYKTQVNVAKKKTKIFIIAVWIYALFFVGLSRIGISQEISTLLYCHLHLSLPLIILAVVFWESYHALRLHTNQVRTLSPTDEPMFYAHRKRERKVLKAILIVLALFYLTFTPQFIALNITFFRPRMKTEVGFRSFLYTANKILLISSSINPFIYAWRIPKYRRAFKAIFKRGSMSNQQISNIASLTISSRDARSAGSLDTSVVSE